MAKKRVNPLIFRAGITQTWPDTVKLQHYKANVMFRIGLNRQFNPFWYKKLRVIYPDSASSKFMQKKNHESFKEIYGFEMMSQLRRRKYLFFTAFNTQRLRYPRFYRQVDENNTFQTLQHWYKKFKNLSKNRLPLSFHDRNVFVAENQIQMLRNTMLLKMINQQKFVPYALQKVVYNIDTSIGGSTPLRQYQFNVSEIIPPQSKIFISLQRYSFKKAVGYITSRPVTRDYKGRYVVLLSQLNIALHWRSASLFVSVFKAVLEQKQRAPGFIRLLRELLTRIQLDHYNITSIFVHVSGSFGKITRTKVLRFSSSSQPTFHSKTGLDQPINFANTQLVTHRGVLGLSVWFFWSVK